MELANLWDSVLDVTGIRVATEADAADIVRLLRRARHSHIHSGWHLPAHWLGQPGFLMYEQPPKVDSLMNKLWGGDQVLQACLAATSDPPPFAWVQVAAIGDVAAPLAVLAAMLAQAEEALRQTAATEVGWMPVNSDWPDSWLKDLGFTEANRVQTYVKPTMKLPSIKSVPGLDIRPVRVEDIPYLAQIEEAAFTPLWRHSASGLAAARRQAVSFDVALLQGELVGFQLSTSAEGVAHLARLTIAPSVQQQGVGSALLAHAIQGYERRHLHSVSLNTQVDNVVSQRLYEKFGFVPTNQWLSIWVKQL
jgi:ribosomal protein S18 acetylase RimI-like enzyme